MSIEDKFSKDFLRKEYRLNRDAGKSSEADNRIFDLLTGLQVYKDSDIVFSYFSVGTEVDTIGIINEALSEGKKIALPKCIDRNGTMEFYFIKNIAESLVDGFFSIKEPDDVVCSKANCTDNSICLVPGVAFDVSGTRLGLGGGYYDRFLSKFKGVKIGLCYDLCLCQTLPSEEHDVKVDMIVTDKKIYKLK